MNKAYFIGRATRDPEIRYSAQDEAKRIATFSIAVDRKFHRDNEPDADFFNCVAFGKTAEVIEKYVFKGMKLAIVGHIQNEFYEKDGQKKSVTKVYVDEFEFCESKSAQGTHTESNKDNGFVPIAEQIDEELPFA